MNKKFFTFSICLTLCALMSITALSGCGKKKATNGPTPSSTISTTDSASSIFTGDYSVPEGSSSNKQNSSSSNKASSNTNQGSSSSNKANSNADKGSSSSYNEQSTTVPNDWELGDNTTSNQNTTLVQGAGGDLHTDFPEKDKWADVPFKTK